MSSRRVPLSNVPNAANSPYRAVAAAATASKRSQSHGSVQREAAYGQPPLSRRTIPEPDPSNPRTPPRQLSVQNSDGRVQQKALPPQLTAMDRKLLIEQQRQVPQRHTKTERQVNENSETVRQWRRHYRKVFPQFVFYFESIPEDVRLKSCRQILSLGAREEKFFSKDVTHVVTTRQIPADSGTSSSADAGNEIQTFDTQSRTINPLLLEKNHEQTQSTQALPRGKFTFEATLGKKPSINGRTDTIDGDSKRLQAGSFDVLSRAKEMGMKIWALEKLQRMMATMFENETESATAIGHRARGGTVAGIPRSTREADLNRILRNERLNGPADRDPTVATKEMITFKGPFIYVHDLEEKCRPVMVREYPKVNHREEGIWPQFRSVSDYKCPFVEEPDYPRRDHNKDKEGQEKPAQKRCPEDGIYATARAVASQASKKASQPSQGACKAPLGVIEDGANRGAVKSATAPMPSVFQPPKVIPAKRGSPERMFAPSQGQRLGNTIRMPRFCGGEPVASGVQPSNITSAIRSQMISSTAAAPGAKAGTSKEVIELKRKVLEKNSGPTAKTMLSKRTTDHAGAGRTERINPNFRAAKRKANEKFGYIDEDFTPSEEEENARRVAAADKARITAKKPARRDPKPGYCENCKEKFEDFEEHTLSRRHRKFAVTNENWNDLDALLNQLSRPVKQ
ncbi:MAG: hypothetical protein M1833_003734 [Piccolia ochrophora]|nr:MAG: hypothetical protein M1833_003734 [Piccolia ochrophora]